MVCKCARYVEFDLFLYPNILNCAHLNAKGIRKVVVVQIAVRTYHTFATDSREQGPGNLTTLPIRESPLVYCLEDLLVDYWELSSKVALRGPELILLINLGPLAKM